ncbi:AAA family ATPase [Hyphomonas sp.]|uniref:AAA family ATPase n=1 Tax=Hyphomonas sp. TaxID=87 RepID=UPI0025C3A297|nr:AAA family ATPase [Hyphomonas sp.]
MDAPKDANDVHVQGGEDTLRRIFDQATTASRVHAPPTKKKLTPTAWTPPDPAAVPRRPWIYGHLFMRGTLTVTVAPGGMGKSILALTEAIAMAAQRDLLGETLPEGGLRVWYVNCEDPDGAANPELTRRATAVCKHYGLNAEDLAGRLFLDSAVLTPIKLAGVEADQRSYAVDEPEFARLEQEIRLRAIDVVIFDPFVSIHDLNENDNPMIDRLAKRLVKLASTTNCAVHLVHHTRKSNGSENDADSSRGASALVAAARIVRVLNGMTANEADKAELPKGSHRRFFRTSLDKQNLAPAQSDRNWHQLMSVDLGNGTPPLGLDSDLVGVPQKWAWPEQKVEISLHSIRRIQEALHEKALPAHQTATEWAGWVIADVMGFSMIRQGRKSPEGHAPVLRLQEMLVQQGWLVLQEISDSRRGGTRQVLAVGTWADTSLGDESSFGCDEPQLEDSDEKDAALPPPTKKQRSRRKPKSSSGSKPAEG